MAPVALSLLVLGGCAADAGATAGSPTPTVPVATVAPAPHRSLLLEARTAHDRAWAAYARGDRTSLASGFAGPALALARRGALPLTADAGEADVLLVDAGTAVVTVGHRASTLRREAGTWKVTEAASLG